MYSLEINYIYNRCPDLDVSLCYMSITASRGCNTNTAADMKARQRMDDVDDDDEV